MFICVERHLSRFTLKYDIFTKCQYASDIQSAFKHVHGQHFVLTFGDKHVSSQQSAASNENHKSYF